MVRFALMLPVLFVACAPQCERVCRNVLRCGLDSERISQQQCEENCERQEQLYAFWEDEHLQRLFDDHRRCLVESTCGQIDEGVCYDGFEDLFLFDDDKQLPEPVSPLLDTVEAAP